MDTQFHGLLLDDRLSGDWEKWGCFRLGDPGRTENRPRYWLPSEVGFVRYPGQDKIIRAEGF